MTEILQTFNIYANDMHVYLTLTGAKAKKPTAKPATTERFKYETIVRRCCH